jgi:hypothetical protein
MTPSAVLRTAVALFVFAAGFGVAVFTLKSGYFSHPIGVAQLVDGGTYVGEILDGRLEGAGTIEWPNGSRYEGELRGGLLHGSGFFEDGHGTRYEGDFRDGQFTGQGEILFSDGGHYEGETRDWMMEGEGIYTIDDQQYSGTFVQGEFTGQGEHLNSGKPLYRGAFRNWQYHGRGIHISGDETWRGKFVDGFLVEGVHRSGEDGSRYKGEFSFGRYHGKGELRLANGDRYTGEFRYGDYHGKGTMALAEPREGISEYDGTWREGMLVESDAAAFVENYRSDVERALYREAEMLEEALAAVAQGEPGQPEVYFLGIAGDGTQRVFSREATAFRDYLDQGVSLSERQVTLINDRTQIGKRPMATRTSIERALLTIGKRMNPEDDVLVLYITSHGSDDHEILLKNPHIGLDDLPAQTLADMLAASGIRWRVIVVSACYSGGFIESLRSEHSLILTAAAADRTSFGCSDEADLTYFGRALLDSLSRSTEPAQVYRLLSEAVTAREEEEDLDPSQPQFYLGQEMEKKLARHDIGLFREPAVPGY